MSAGGAFGGNRGARPVPPEKGVFPLDHNHECEVEKKEYLGCLKSGGHKSEKCRAFSKKYLQCRMAKNLMAKQDINELGFSKESEADGPEDGKYFKYKKLKPFHLEAFIGNLEYKLLSLFLADRLLFWMN